MKNLGWKMARAGGLVQGQENGAKRGENKVAEGVPSEVFLLIRRRENENGPDQPSAKEVMRRAETGQSGPEQCCPLSSDQR